MLVLFVQYQGLPIEYSFNAHHDVSTLISYAGGPDAFLARLDAMFEPGLNPTGPARFNHTLFNPGNEPSFNTPYMYHWVGRPDLSVRQSRRVAKSYFGPTPDGLPGNSDAGAMESWVLWNMIGLYPVTGQTTFLVGSPWFSDVTITLGSAGSDSRHELRMTVAYDAEYDEREQQEDAYYVQSLRVNGQDWGKSWVTWDDVFVARENGDSGGISVSSMEFVLGKEPGTWATGKDAELPPSPASEASQQEEVVAAGDEEEEEEPMMRPQWWRRSFGG